MLNDKEWEILRKEYLIVRIFAWIALALIIIAMAVFIFFVSKSHAANGANAAAQAVANPYANSGGSNVSGLLNYGQKNINLSCNQSPNFLDVSYAVGSSGDITATIQMNTDNGSSYNYSYTVPYIISGVCSNGFISCPAGEWYGNGVTCNNYAITYSPSAGFSLQSLGSNIMGVPQTTTQNVPLNGVQVSSVTSTQTSGGLANCFCVNDSCEQGGTPLSDIQVQQILTNLGGQAVSAVQSGSPDTVGVPTLNDSSSPYSVSYSGGNSSSCNGNSNYNTTNNLEGLYNQGGSSLNTEVSSGEVSTANTNTATALGLTAGTTPNSLLVTTQNNSFGGMSGGTCQIENQVIFQQTTIYTPADFVPASIDSGGVVAVGAGGDNGTAAQGYTCGSSANSICIEINDTSNAHACGPLTLSGGLTYSGSTITGWGQCSGSIQVDSSTGIVIGGTVTCNLVSTTGCGSGGSYFGGSSAYLYFSGNGTNLAISGHISGNISIDSSYQYYPVYSRPVNTCATYQNNSNCSLTSEQVCDQTDSNCVVTLQNSNPVGSPPDFNWTYEQTDDNLPVSMITWSINMNGTTVQVLPNETTDTIDYGTLATSSSSAGGGNDFPYVNQTWTCSGNPPYNFTTMNQQQTTVTGSASMNSNDSAFSYTGVNGNAHNNISVDNTANSAGQQEECVVSQINTNTTITSSVQATTAVQNTPGSPTNTDTEILNCTNSGTTDSPVWNCPAPSGYTVQTNCTDASNINNNNFAPAMVELEVLDKAGSSLICSAN
ncbi:MAG: hypothetical protein ACYCSQ_00850 [bacterium]